MGLPFATITVDLPAEWATPELACMLADGEFFNMLATDLQVQPLEVEIREGRRCRVVVTLKTSAPPTYD